MRWRYRIFADARSGPHACDASHERQREKRKVERPLGEFVENVTGASTVSRHPSPSIAGRPNFDKDYAKRSGVNKVRQKVGWV